MRPYSAMMDQVILGREGSLGREGKLTDELGECRDRDGRGWSCASRANVNVKWVAADKIRAEWWGARTSSQAPSYGVAERERA